MNRAVAAILVVTSLLGGGSTVYSAFQIQVPSRTSLKVTPDAASVWSWHEEIQLPIAGGNTTVRERVLVDFNGNGRMDTEDPDLRVSITDLQLALPPFDLPVGAQVSCWLTDGQRRRWTLFKTGVPFPPRITEIHLTTPLILEPRSELFVEFGLTNSSFAFSVEISLIGRVVVL